MQVFSAWAYETQMRRRGNVHARTLLADGAGTSKESCYSDAILAQGGGGKVGPRLSCNPRQGQLGIRLLLESQLPAK